MYQNLSMSEQSCNLWKGKKVLKQCEKNFADSKTWAGKLKVEMKY